MTRPKRAFHFLLAGAGLLAALLAAILVLGPRLVNTDRFRAFVRETLERRTGVRISYSRADVSLFPRPRVIVRQASFEKEGLASGKVAAIEAEPEALPLLRGRLLVRSLLLEGPDVRLRIPPREKPEKPFSRDEIEKDLSSLLDALRETAPGAVVTVRDGRLDLSDGEGTMVALRGLNARAELPPGRLTLSIHCASEHWDMLLADSTLDPKGLRGDTRVEAKRFRPDGLLRRLAPGAAPWLGETEFSFQGRIASEGLRRAKAELSGAAPLLTLRRGPRSRILRIGSFKGSAEWVEEGHRSARFDLSVDDPAVRLSGSFSREGDSSPIEARLKGQGADLPSIRAAALALAGDSPEVRAACDMVRAGTLSRFSLESSGSSAAELADPRKFRARATAGGVAFTVPGIDLPLRDAGGELSLSGGILGGKGLTARVGKSTAREGTLRLGLFGKDPPFRLDCLANADLAELQPLLRRIIEDEDYRKESDRFRDVRGAVSGRLTLGDTLSSIGFGVSLTKIDFSGKHDLVPFPIAIRGGQASFDENGLSVTGLQGSVGGSGFSGLTGRLTFAEPLTLAIREGAARLALGELHPWISSMEGARESMKAFRTVAGTADISSLSLEGPLRDPDRWTFEARGSMENVEADTSLLPAPVAVSRARFLADREDLDLSDVEAAFLDSKFRGSVRLHGYRTGIGRAAVSAAGSVGGGTVKWAFGRFGIRSQYEPRTPFEVVGSTISLDNGVAAVKADLSWPEGAKLSFSLRKAPGSLSVEQIAVRDKASDARASFLMDGDQVKATFSGALSQSTLDAILPSHMARNQKVRGEMELRLDLRDPARSTARGAMAVEDLRIPWKPLAPLAIRRATLSTEGNRVRLSSSEFTWDNVPFTLSGTAEIGSEAILADLDLSAGDVDLKRLARSILPEGDAAFPSSLSAAETRASEDAEKPLMLWGLPVRGILRFRADSLSEWGLTWRPFAGMARLGEDGVVVVITEAVACGISTPGGVVFDPDGMTVILGASTSGANLEETSVCLSGKVVSITGTYTLSVRVAGRGTGDALIRSLEGPVELKVKDGRINKMHVLAKILTYLNFSELFRGKLPDEKQGFPYKTIVVSGKIKDGKLLLEKVAMDAPSMGVAATGEVDLLARTLDINVLVSPLRTADAIVRRIPVVRDILNDTLISVPVSVTGDVMDPSVVAMDPKAVGKDLMGLLERTLETPLRILSPFLPSFPSAP